MDIAVYGIVATLSGDVMIVTALAARWLSAREPHVGAWLAGFALLFLGHALWTPFMLGGESLAMSLAVLVTIVAGTAFLMRGTYRALGRDTPRLWWVAYGAAIAVGVVLVTIGPPAAVATPALVTMAIALLFAGSFLIRSQPSMLGAWFAGLGMTALSLNILSYPIMANFLWYLPIGTLVGVLTQLVTGFGLLLLDVQVATRRAAGVEAALHNLVQNANIGIFRSTPDGRILMANPAFVEMLGYETEAQVLALRLDTEVYVDPGQRAALLRDHEGRPVENQVVQWLRADGTVISVAVDGREVLQDGQLAYYEAFARDITRATQLEAELQQARRIEAVGRLAGGVAHDFNNLLTVIAGNLEMLADAEPHTDEALTLLAESAEAHRQASRLTRQLLAIGRPRQARQDLVDLGEVVTNLGAVLGRSLGETIELQTTLDEGCVVVGERSQLEQIVLNLALNARDALESGGTIRISLRARAPRFPYSDLADRDWALLEVEDDGAGMTEEVRTRIFEPFFTTKSEGRGTGLGLATVHALVRSHRGSIDVDSAPSRGTKFRIWLPMEDVGEDVKPGAGAEGARTARVLADLLVVDDRPDVRTVMQRILEGHGHRVRVARDGHDALQIAAELPNAPDLLVTDVVMPGMSGPELASALRRRWPHLPVLFVSGFPGDLDPQAAQDGSRYLAKPFSPALLLAEVEAAIADRGAQQDNRDRTLELT